MFTASRKLLLKNGKEDRNFMLEYMLLVMK